MVDHPRLFASLFRALAPGGRVVAQCGGAGNLRRHHARAAALMADADVAACFTGWREPWEFADADTTRTRLEAPGFVDVATRVTRRRPR